jgi:acyl dehydratase
MSNQVNVTPNFDLPTLTLPPVNRTTLVLFCGASGDHNTIHIDIDAARKAGMPDVFAQGMLGMAWLGRVITQWIPQSQLRQFNVRFQGITHLGHIITCKGTVAETFVVDGESRAKILVSTVNQYGETKIAGEVIVALSK